MSIKKNFLYNILLTLTNVLFPLITFPYISRTLLVESIGKVNFAMAVMDYFIMFASLGIPTYGIRVCAKVREDKQKLSKTVHELLIINSVTTILTYVIFGITLSIVSRFQENRILLIINSISLLLNSIGMNWLYSALEEYRYITFRSIIFKVLSLGCILCMINKPEDFLIYAMINVFAISGSNILNLIHSRKFISYRCMKPYNFKPHIVPILTFFATSVAISVYSKLDIVMLGFMKGNIEVGYYSAAMKIRTALATIVTSLGVVLLPRLSFYAKKECFKQFEELFRKSLKFTFFLAIPCTIFFVLYANSSIVLLAGKEFSEATLTLQLLVPTVLIAGLSNVIGIQLLVPWNKESKVLISVILGASFDFVFNRFLIPRYGSAGAAFSTLLAEIIVLIYQFLVVHVFLIKMFEGLKLYKIFISSFISILVLMIGTYFFKESIYLILIAFCLFTGTYMLMLICLKEKLIIEMINFVFDRIRRKKK